MKETELWARMQTHLGQTYCKVWAAQFSLATLGGQTVNEALVSGTPCKAIWRAVWEALELPPRDR